MFGRDIVVYLVEVFRGKSLDLGLEDAVEIVLREEEGDVVLLAEAVQHLLIPLGKIKIVGLDHADAVDAGFLSALDSAVTSEDAIVLIDND
mgnify:CR=1 FL=1